MFEFDKSESKANKVKHGIDFVEAQELWDDENRFEFDSDAVDEKRVLMLAEYDGKLWTAVYTVRGEKIRIISVRRARDYEEEDYNGGRV